MLWQIGQPGSIVVAKEVHNPLYVSPRIDRWPKALLLSM